MPNEKEVEDEKVVEEDLDSLDETTDWKAKAQEIEQKRREDGIRNRERTKALKEKLAGLEPKKPAETQDKPKTGFDRADKAFLLAAGIKSSEYTIVQEIMTETGKDMDAVLESNYFQATLKEKRDLQASKDAIPTGSKRSASAIKDSVEYHLAKGTPLSKIEDRELRHEVRRAKEKAATQNSQFSENPIIGR